MAVEKWTAGRGEGTGRVKWDFGEEGGGGEGVGGKEGEREEEGGM